MLKSKQISDLAFRSYKTILHRDNDLNTKFEGLKAMVYADPDNSNNGVYELSSDLTTWVRAKTSDEVLQFSSANELIGLDVEVVEFYNNTNTTNFNLLSDYNVELLVNGVYYDLGDGKPFWFSDAVGGDKNSYPSSINNRLFVDTENLNFELDSNDTITFKYSILG